MGRARSAVVLAGCLLLMWQANANADGASKKDDIWRLFDVIKIEDTITQVEAAMAPQLNQVIQKMVPSLTDDQLKLFDSYFREEMHKVVPRLLSDAVDVYDRNFTDQQIRDLIAFYQTTTGQHLLEVQPTLLAGTIAAGQKWGRYAGEQAGKRLQEAIQQGL